MSFKELIEEIGKQRKQATSTIPLHPRQREMLRQIILQEPDRLDYSSTQAVKIIFKQGYYKDHHKDMLNGIRILYKDMKNKGQLI